MAFCGNGRGREHANYVHAAYHSIAKGSGKAWTSKGVVKKGYVRDGGFWSSTISENVPHWTEKSTRKIPEAKPYMGTWHQSGQAGQRLMGSALLKSLDPASQFPTPLKVGAFGAWPPAWGSSTLPALTVPPAKRSLKLSITWETPRICSIDFESRLQMPDGLFTPGP